MREIARAFLFAAGAHPRRIASEPIGSWFCKSESFGVGLPNDALDQADQVAE
jgi:hypothetical protein